MQVSGFGSMRVTARADHDAAIGVIRQAVELGVDHIDTAAFHFSPGGILGTGKGPRRYATELIRDALTPYPEGEDSIAERFSALAPLHRSGRVRAELLRQAVDDTSETRVEDPVFGTLTSSHWSVAVARALTPKVTESCR